MGPWAECQPVRAASLQSVVGYLRSSSKLGKYGSLRSLLILGNWYAWNWLCLQNANGELWKAMWSLHRACIALVKVEAFGCGKNAPIRFQSDRNRVARHASLWPFTPSVFCPSRGHGRGIPTEQLISRHDSVILSLKSLVCSTPL